MHHSKADFKLFFLLSFTRYFSHYLSWKIGVRVNSSENFWLEWKLESDDVIDLFNVTIFYKGDSKVLVDAEEHKFQLFPVSGISHSFRSWFQVCMCFQLASS